jgi:hypothetical protein
MGRTGGGGRRKIRPRSQNKRKHNRDARSKRHEDEKTMALFDIEREVQGPLYSKASITTSTFTLIILAQMSQLLTTLSTNAEGGDTLLVCYYLSGIGLGLVLVIVLAFFPGRRGSRREEWIWTGERALTGCCVFGLFTTGSASQLREQVPSKAEKSSREQQHILKDDSTKPWEGDQITTQDLERLGKKLDLTPEQMNRVMETSRRQAMGGGVHDYDRGGSWTPHQKLNTLVYVILFGILIHVVNRDYGNLATVWFVRIFPKEAKTLGIFYPTPQ